MGGGFLASVAFFITSAPRAVAEPATPAVTAFLAARLTVRLTVRLVTLSPFFLTRLTVRLVSFRPRFRAFFATRLDSFTPFFNVGVARRVTLAPTWTTFCSLGATVRPTFKANLPKLPQSPSPRCAWTRVFH